MTDIQVRQAALDDTGAISRLFQARIPVWQRLDAHGRVEDMPYEALSVYERWLHGGAWMSLETGAIQLSRLLSGAGYAFVAEREGDILAYAEAYHGIEPLPVANHLHLAYFVAHPDEDESSLSAALVAQLLAQAKALKCQHVTVSRVPEMESVFAHGDYTLKPLSSVHRFNLPARTGQIFYQATEHLNPDAAQISGWYMPVGRLGSARQQWEWLWHRTWDALPEVRQQRAHRMRFSAAGQEAFVFCRQQLYDPRAAEIYCWSPKALTNQLLSAIRDWTHRESYRVLVMAVMEDTVRTLGTEAEPDGYVQEVCAVIPTDAA